MNPPFDVEQQLHRHGHALRELAGELVRDPSAADDAVQEVWVAALRRGPGHAGSFGGWLRTVLLHVVSRLRRGERRRAEHEAVGAAARGSVAEDHAAVRAREELAERLLAAVRNLDVPYRDVLWQRFFEGKAPRAIAAASGVPVATVKSRLQRGLRMLRERLEQDGGGFCRGAFVAAFGLREGMAAAVVAMTTGGVLVATWTKVTAVAAALVAAALLCWHLEPTAPLPNGSTSPDGRSVAVAGVPDRTTEVPADRSAASSESIAAPMPPVTAPVAGAPGFVRGRAVDADSKQPLAGVRIARATRAAGEVALETITAGDGTFVLEARVGALTRIDLRRADRVTVEYRGTVRGNGHVEELGDVPLRPGRTMRGHLDGPVAIPADVLVTVDFDVKFTNAWAELRGEARTDGGGRFVMSEPLPLGRTKWMLPFGGVMLATYTTMLAQPTIVDIGEVVPEEIVLPVIPRPSIRGIVVDDGGQPIGSGIRLSDQPGFGLVGVRADGTFTMLQMRPGTATPVFVAEASGFQPVPPIADVPWGTEGLRIVLVRTKAFAIEVVDPDGAPIEQFGVAVNRPGLQYPTIGKVRQRGRHEGGRLVVDDVVAGATHLRVIPMAAAWSPSEPIAADAEPLRVVLRRRVQLGVQVRRGGEPVAAVDVTLVREIGAPLRTESVLPPPPATAAQVWMYGPGVEVLSSGVTDESGSVRLLRDQDLGNCVLRLLQPGRPPALVRGLVLPADGRLVVELPGQGSVGGRVELNGCDSGGVRLEIAGTQYIDDRALGVDADGNLASAWLHAGNYVVRLQRRLRLFHTLATQDIVVSEATPVRLHFDLAAFPLASVRGVVTCAGSLPTELTIEMLHAEPGGGLQVVGSAKVGAGGAFSIAPLLPGAYRAAFRTAPGVATPVGAIVASEFVLAAATETSMQLVFAPRRLVVRLQRPDGTVVRGERVLVRCAGTTWPTSRLFTPLVDELMVFDPAPELPLEFRVWTDGSPWSAPVVMPAGRAAAEVTVVLPAGAPTTR